jgi:rhodanese-related sulfurtransferase
MERLFEYAARHPFLAGGTVAIACVLAAYEVSKARAGGRSVGPTEAIQLLNQGALLVDVRTRQEFDAGHVIDARHVPQDQLAQAGELLKRFKDKIVIMCCDTGTRSAAAARTLQGQGFGKVVTLRGGLQAWRGENLPLVKEGQSRQKGGGSQA